MTSQDGGHGTGRHGVPMGPGGGGGIRGTVPAGVRALSQALLVLLCVAVPAAVTPSRGEGEMAAYEESQVKAALLYNFAKFVEWPESAFGAAGGDLVYAVVGSDPFGGALSALAGKTALGRTVSFRGTITLDEAGTCHVVYVSASEKDRIAQVVDRFKGKSVLTVGDVAGFAERGGVIGFTKDGNRIGFEVNEDAAAQAGLKISPKLLALGKVVKGRPGGR